MSIETRASNHYSPKMKESRRSVREELMLPDFIEEPTYYKSTPARKQRSYFWEDFGFNLMNYVLVPLSCVALFGIFVYAEVSRSTGY